MQETYKINELKRIAIEITEMDIDPREFQISKLCIKDHRRYNFPNELNINFNEDDLYLDNYYVYELDFYEHSWIEFSISWRWMQCKFDTSKNCWIIAIPKSYNDYDWNEWSISKNKDKWKEIFIDEQTADKMVDDDIEEYNNYLAWEVYEILEQEIEVYTSANWNTIEQWNTTESILPIYWYDNVKKIMEGEYQIIL